MKIMVPYEQGALDGLCGLYALVNASRMVVKGLDYLECEKVFRRMLRYIEARKSLSRVVSEGIGDDDVFRIARAILRDKYNVNLTRLYRRDDSPTASQVFTTLAKLMEPGRVAFILSIETTWIEHWTVLKRITPKEIYLFDSVRICKVKRSQCTTRKATMRRPVYIDPGCIFSLRIEEHCARIKLV